MLLQLMGWAVLIGSLAVGIIGVLSLTGPLLTRSKDKT